MVSLARFRNWTANVSFIRKDELMREAKNVATVFGAVTVCLLGGLGIAFKATPDISTGNNVEIEEPASEAMTTAANVTSVSTTTAIVTTLPQTTTKQNITTTAAAAAVEATEAPSEAEEKEEEEFFTEEEGFSKEMSVYYGVQLSIDKNDSDSYFESSDKTAVTTSTAPAVTTTSETTTTTTTSATTTTTTTTTTAATTTTAVTTTAPATTSAALPISDSDFVILCNVVAHEAGCSWISEYDKAKVVEVIMNRVYSPLFPNTVTAVLSQPNQFTGAPSYAFGGYYVSYCTEACKNAVRLYFSDPSQFSHGYLYFWGDGYQNHFS